MFTPLDYKKMWVLRALRFWRIIVWKFFNGRRRYHQDQILWILIDWQRWTRWSLCVCHAQMSKCLIVYLMIVHTCLEQSNPPNHLPQIWESLSIWHQPSWDELVSFVLKKTGLLSQSFLVWCHVLPDPFQK